MPRAPNRKNLIPLKDLALFGTYTEFIAYFLFALRNYLKRSDTPNLALITHLNYYDFLPQRAIPSFVPRIHHTAYKRNRRDLAR